MRPRPMTLSVVPVVACRRIRPSHLSCRAHQQVTAAGWAGCAISMAMVCSAVLTVLPPGDLTRCPRRRRRHDKVHADARPHHSLEPPGFSSSRRDALVADDHAIENKNRFVGHRFEPAFVEVMLLRGGGRGLGTKFIADKNARVPISCGGMTVSTRVDVLSNLHQAIIRDTEKPRPMAGARMR